MPKLSETEITLRAEIASKRQAARAARAAGDTALARAFDAQAADRLKALAAAAAKRKARATRVREMEDEGCSRTEAAALADYEA